MDKDREEALLQLTVILDAIRQRLTEESVGVIIDSSKAISIGKMNLDEYMVGARITNSQEVTIGIINATAPKDLRIIEEIIQDLILAIKTMKPKSRLSEIWQKLAPLAGWANLVYNILNKIG